MPEDKAMTIIEKFLGNEIGGVRKEGVVDAFSTTDFHDMFEKMKAGLPNQFVDWLLTTKGRVRNIPDTMKLCMLRDVRVAAGLGDPPNKYVNNWCEAMNHATKEQVGQGDFVKFLELIKECVFDEQLKELTKAIYKR